MEARGIMPVTLASIMLLAAPCMAHGAEASRWVVVSSSHSIAANRPAAPASQNFIRVYVNNAAWGSTTCRQDAADIARTDTHLVAQLLAALGSEKAITLTVDDTLRPIDNACQVTAMDVDED